MEKYVQNSIFVEFRLFIMFIIKIKGDINTINPIDIFIDNLK